MGQVFANKERLGTLTKTGNTTVQLSPSVITLGGKQYSTGNLTCDLSTDLDTGSVQPNTAYYIYAVVVSGSVVLKASLNSSAPVGFNDSKKAGALFTNGSSQVDYVAELNSSEKAVRKLYYQKKNLANTIQNTSGQPAEMFFYNLEIGRTYEIIVYVSAGMYNGTVRGTGSLSYVNNGIEVVRSRDSRSDSSGQFEDYQSGSSNIFVAQADTLIPNINASQQSGGNVYVFAPATYAILREIDDEETTKFNN